MTFDIPIYFLIGGIALWVFAYVLANVITHNKKKKTISFSYNLFLDSICSLESIFFFVLGLVMILCGIVMLDYTIAALLYEGAPELLTFKEYLDSIIQVTILLGSVITASVAYLFKNKISSENNISKNNINSK